MRLKESTGWFAAGPRMLAALRLLSDGAFKLFVYLALTADRGSGCLALRQADLARALGKSRNSIGAYLEELARQHICVIKPAPNQHQPGEIQITDDFWPYHRDPVSGLCMRVSDEGLFTDNKCTVDVLVSRWDQPIQQDA